jgi:hypothetical protein
MAWPEGKRFAFTVFDDTDSATLQNVRGVYDFLTDLGLRTTKSAWPLAGSRPAPLSGETCADPAYRAWLCDLQRAGFEIGWHNATYHTSRREETARGLETFAAVFGRYPVSMANHAGNDENLYWGDARVSGLHRLVYGLATRFRNRGRFRGHLEGELFWGDLCRKHIRYARNFAFPELNTLKLCPEMPYHDPERPWVRYWYASCDGSDVRAYCRRIAERRQDTLEEEGGACIMYTHFAKGFQPGGLDPEFRRLMERLATKAGWFVPVSTLLDHLLELHGPRSITRTERRRLERAWLRYKLRVGTT